ncbi:MAG TPA: hypothetical protein VHK06_06710, partial [Candidatus Limnocylindria bacterium]|nr:hypothetical protein [Candidatus Limnocylindria bacterium]
MGPAVLSRLHRAATGLMVAALLVLGVCLAAASVPARGADEGAAVVSIPPEPDAAVLPDAPTVQVLTVDLDGDGGRELVRLVAGQFDGVFLEAWRFAGAQARQVGERVTVLPDQRPGRPDPIRMDAPVRLVAWNDGSRERLLVATRPRFEERDIGPPCCLILEEPVVEAAELRLVDVALPSNAADVVIALDLDGDGRDELLTTRSLPPQGDITYPLEVRVHRFDGSTFGLPASWTFPLGSGDSVFHLGDSDGEPGEEAGLLATLGSGGLLRLAWRDGELVQEHSGAVWPLAARAILAEGGAAVAAAGSRRLAVLSWPPGRRAELIASASDLPTILLGTLRHGEDTTILVTEGESAGLLPVSSRLVPLLDEPLSPSAPARAVREASLLPYVGPLPLGGDDPGTFAFAGRALRWDGGAPLVRDIGSLPNTVPVGSVGVDDAVALVRADFFLAEPDEPRGGPLRPATTIPGASVSIVGRQALLAAEDSTAWQPEVAVIGRDAEGRLLSGRDGFDVEVAGPPGTLLDIRGEAEVGGPAALP